MFNILNCALALGIASCVALYPSVRSNKKVDVNNIPINNVYFGSDNEGIYFESSQSNITSSYRALINTDYTGYELMTFYSLNINFNEYDIATGDTFPLDSWDVSSVQDVDWTNIFAFINTGDITDYSLTYLKANLCIDYAGGSVTEYFTDFKFYLDNDVVYPNRFAFLINLNFNSSSSYGLRSGVVSWLYTYSNKSELHDDYTYAVFDNLDYVYSYYSAGSLYSNISNYDTFNFTVTILRNNDYYDSYKQGYEKGQHDGYVDGYHTGYYVGKNEGINISSYSANNLWMSVVDTPILMIRSLFNFDFFGVNMFVIVAGLLTVLVVLFVIKKVVK